MPSKKWVEPTLGYIQCAFIQMHHRNHCNRYATDGHDDVFDQVTQHNAMHSAKHGIKNCKQCEHDPVKMCNILRRDIKWHVIFDLAPWNKNFNKLSKTNKPVSQESKTTDQRKC